MENKTSKPFYKKWWVIVGVILVVLYIIGRSGNQQIMKAVSEQESQRQYVEVFKFNGNGTKKSEPFTINGNRFKIAYSCDESSGYALCIANVYRVDNQHQELIMNSSQAVKDETIIYGGSGQYYISANTMGNFTMTVYDYK